MTYLGMEITPTLLNRDGWVLCEIDGKLNWIWEGQIER